MTSLTHLVWSHLIGWHNPLTVTSLPSTVTSLPPYCDVTTLYCEVTTLYYDVTTLYCDVTTLYCDVINPIITSLIPLSRYLPHYKVTYSIMTSLFRYDVTYPIITSLWHYLHHLRYYDVTTPATMTAMTSLSPLL